MVYLFSRLEKLLDFLMILAWDSLLEANQQETRHRPVMYLRLIWLDYNPDNPGLMIWV